MSTIRPSFDRSAEDVGNAILFEHVNLRVPDQRLANLFYIGGLGLTRDPWLMTGIDNMWVNVGRQQIHLPEGPAQRVRGRIGLVLPDLDQLPDRLRSVAPKLAGTMFDWAEGSARVDLVCPWGNRVTCHAPDPVRFGRVGLGLAYLETEIVLGASRAIGHFYRSALGLPVRDWEEEGAIGVDVIVGSAQWLRFVERDVSPEAYDGHHVQLYLADFSRPHRWLAERALITEESNPWQYRFVDLIDPEEGRCVLQLEHEIRSLTHPLFGRPLVNRNPAMSPNGFVAGLEHRPWVHTP